MIHRHKLKNKVIHLSTVHGTTFGTLHGPFSNRQTKLFIAKWSSSSYNKSSSLTGKKPLLCLSSLVLYKKTKMLGFPKVTFGLPNVPISLYPLQNITFYKVWPVLLIWRGSLGLPKISSMLLPPWRVLQTIGVLGIVYSARTYLLASEWLLSWPCSDAPVPPRAVH